MTTDTRTDIRHPGRLWALWTGLLLAPAAWLTSLEVGYVLVRPACADATVLPQHLTHAAFLLVAFAGMVIAWRARQAERDFLSTLGVATSALFVLVLVAQWIPVFLIHACQ
jgi:hypothetical protein